MNIAFDGRKHEHAFVRSLDLVHKWFEKLHGRLHRLGGLQHKRQLHLARTEKIADRFHAVKQNIIDDLERRIFFEPSL